LNRKFLRHFLIPNSTTLASESEKIITYDQNYCTGISSPRSRFSLFSLICLRKNDVVFPFVTSMRPKTRSVNISYPLRDTRTAYPTACFP